MPRLILPSSIISTDKDLSIYGHEAHYLINVLRLREGDEIQIIDDTGRLHKGEVRLVKKKEVIVKLIETEDINTEPELHLILIQAILKGEKMDFIIQKSTELGVREIYPIITSRTIVRETAKEERWKRIAKEAVRQCGRTEVPLIHKPVLFEYLLESTNQQLLPLPPISQGFIFYESAQKGLKEMASKIQSSKNISLIVGPEGGFARDEVEKAISKGFIPVSLGPRILRAETATVVALSLLQFLYGDIG
jgi:16S rRNA (uracil1498-N3)-methyltransferase